MTTLAKRLLLVDDEIDFLMLVTARLEASGYHVITARDGLEALAKAKALKPDLIILDLMLPKLNGYQVCRMLKFDPSYATIPIVLCTALSQEKDERLGRECGADAYLQKPFKAEEMLAEVERLLTASRQLKEVQP